MFRAGFHELAIDYCLQYTHEQSVQEFGKLYKRYYETNKQSFTEAEVKDFFDDAYKLGDKDDMYKEALVHLMTGCAFTP